MAENLNMGDMKIVEGKRLIGHNNEIIEKYCYDNNPDNCKTYGGLYIWDEMMQYEPSDKKARGTTQGICPSGWHIPTDEEWKTLETYIGGDGDKLKDRGSSPWSISPDRVIDSSGFDALAGGRVGHRVNPLSPKFEFLEEYAPFWTSTDSPYNRRLNAWNRFLHKSSSKISRSILSKDVAISVRCVKN